jgi:GNAT superfamily N-acetyltransferase
MKIIKTSILGPEQKERICHLWNKEYPIQLSVTTSSFDEFLKMSDLQNHYLIVNQEMVIAGWAFTFDRSGERWFSIIIDSAYQRHGYGRLLLALMKEKETRLNGWVIDHPHDVRQNGEPYLSPLPFYLQHGFTSVPDIRLEDNKISAIKITWTK